MVAGKRYCARQFKEIINQVTKYAGVPNPGEIWPILNWIGYEKKMMMKLGERTDVFLQGLIDEHQMKKST